MGDSRSRHHIEHGRSFLRSPLHRRTAASNRAARQRLRHTRRVQSARTQSPGPKIHAVTRRTPSADLRAKQASRRRGCMTCAALRRRLLASGVDVNTVARLLGHESAVTTLRRYSHLLHEFQRRPTGWAHTWNGCRKGRREHDSPRVGHVWNTAGASCAANPHEIKILSLKRTGMALVTREPLAPK